MSEKKAITDEKVRGVFCWHDLMTTDVDKSKAYYSELLGWTFQEPEPQGYSIISDGVQDGGMGGVMKLPPSAAGVPTHWLPYVTVADIDAALETTKAMGGSVVFGPHQIPNVGKMAHITDNQGAHIHAIELDQNMPAPGMPEPGQFCWYTLAVAEADAAESFYAKVFGWSIMDNDPGDGTQMKLFTNGGQPIAGIFALPPGGAIPPNWSCSVAVADIQATKAKVTELGGQIVMGPMPVGKMGDTMMTADNVGAHLAFFQANMEAMAEYTG